MKAKIITLKGYEISEKISKECIEQAEKFGIDVTVFDAINGFDSASHLEKLNIKRSGKFKKNKLGVTGCFLSHYYLWTECVSSNIPYLILEHDGYFIKPLELNILDTFEDILKLDNGNPYKASYEEWLAVHENDDAKIYIIEDRAGGGGNHETKAGWNTIGAYAYIIKPHAAKKLIDWVNENGFLPADHLLATKILKVAHHHPTIVRLHPFYNGRVKMMSSTTYLEELSKE
jgi:glycosyl transferase family 25